MSGVYNADSIFTPERLQHVRMRPTAYFNSTDIEGLMHQALEIITNSIDEIALMSELAGTLQLILCIDAERQTYQLIIRDSGRGLPIEKLLDSYTKLHTSGKFDQGAYEHSGGLFGVGAKASAATAADFVAITSTNEGSAAIRVHEGVTDEVVVRINEVPAQTGVTVVYEPDPLIFPTDIPLFAVEGQKQLITVLQKYCFFHRMNIEFRVHPLALPKTVWTAKIPDVEALVAKYWTEANVVFEEATFDRHTWIRTYFNIGRPFSLKHVIQDIVATTITAPVVREVMMRYEVQFYTVKFDTVGGRFGMVNYVGIDDQKSTHFATVMDTVKIILSGFIKENALRKFFLDQYRLSLYLAVDVKFPGAAFAGTTKTGFISKQFRSIYEPSLQKQLEHPDSQKFLEAYYREIESDIESRYTAEVLGVVKVKNYDRLFEEFPNISEIYTPCWTNNRRIAELFVVEGRSAGSSISFGRNPETQALFKLSGKPFNGITSEDKIRQSAIAIRNHDVYKMLMAVTGINPSKFDLNSLNFGWINILTDADSHGYHITAIVVTNIYALCPDIIASGMIRVVLPPLYSLVYNKKSDSSKIYFRDEKALRDWKIENVYLKHFALGERLINEPTSTRNLTSKESHQFLNHILDISEAIINLSNELLVDADVVERLTYITEMLDPSLKFIDVERIKQVIPDIDSASYIPNGNILIMSIGDIDHVIPLENVWKRLIATVLPLLNQINWRQKQIYITTKTNDDYKDAPISVMKLNSMMTQLDKQFITERYKGLGSMEPSDMERVCLDPDRRNSFTISSVGDVKRIFDLLGSDSGPRKDLIRRK